MIHWAGAITMASLVACAPAVDPDPTNRKAYARSIQQAGDWSACETLTDADLQGECVAMVGGLRARQGDISGAWTVCKSLPDGLWRDECAFLVLEHESGQHVPFLPRCVEAGRFQGRCHAHIVGAASRSALKRAGRGHEAEALADLNRALSTVLTATEARRSARRAMVLSVSNRAQKRQLSDATCGTLPDDLCAAAYARQVTDRSHSTGLGPESNPPWGGLCETGAPTDHAVRVARLPGFTNDMADIAAAGWKLLCAGDVREDGPSSDRRDRDL